MSKSLKESLLAIAAVAALAGAAPAFAGEATAAPEIDGFTSQKSRAEVHAELLAARAAGQMARNEYERQQLAVAGSVSVKTRAQVAAETLAAKRLGLIPSNDFEYATLAPTAEQLRIVSEAGQRAIGVHVASR